MKRLFYVILLITSISFSCQKSSKYPALSNQLADSISKFGNSDVKYAGKYAVYENVTSQDATIQVDKEYTNTYYPWKVNLNKQMVDAFLSHLEKNLKVDSVYKSSAGEFPDIEAEFVEAHQNYVMTDLLKCKLVAYNLTNDRGEKIIIDETDVSINKNAGAISFNPAIWDLQNQRLKGSVTLEISIPYHIDKIELKPGDQHKTFPFSDTKIEIIELQNNVLHYKVQNEKDYVTEPLVDNCNGTKSILSFPEYFYDKLRMKPNLSFKEFVADSAYFELNKLWKKEVKNIHVIYFYQCNPDLIYLFGYKKSEIATKRITIPIDVKII